MKGRQQTAWKVFANRGTRRGHRRIDLPALARIDRGQRPDLWARARPAGADRCAFAMMGAGLHDQSDSGVLAIGIDERIGEACRGKAVGVEDFNRLTVDANARLCETRQRARK